MQIISFLILMLLFFVVPHESSAQTYEYDDRFNTYAEEVNTDSPLSPVDLNSPLFDSLEREDEGSSEDSSEEDE